MATFDTHSNRLRAMAGGSCCDFRPFADDLRLRCQIAGRGCLRGRALHNCCLLVHGVDVVCQSCCDVGALTFGYFRRHCTCGRGGLCWSKNGRNAGSRTARSLALAELMPLWAKADIRYSITSSAVSRSFGGTVKPSALAVFRLKVSSNLVGCSTGSSPGFIPFNILSTYPAVRRKRSTSLGP